MTAEGRREGDQRWYRRLAGWWRHWGGDLVTTIAIALAAYAVVTTQSTQATTQATIRDLEREGLQRRDQTCLVFERQWQADIHRLRQTYFYLSELAPKDLQTPLNIAILRQLPQIEDQVREERPPRYCRGDVGLDDRALESVPTRPPGLPPIPSG